MSALPTLLSSRPLRIQMEKRQVLTFKGRCLEITCLSGIAWLTDGAGAERIIKCGQQVSIRGKGNICIEAFEPTRIQINHDSTSQRFVQLLRKLVRPVSCLKFGPVASS